MNILLMANTSNPRFHDVWRYLSVLDHVDVTEDHRTIENLSQYDLGVSWYYRVIVKQKDLDAFRYGVINFHPGILPQVKGAFTNIWPVIHPDLPCGVSAQVMDAGLDTGPTIFEKRIQVNPEDTGESLWYRLVDAQYELLLEKWPAIQHMAVTGTLPKSSVPSSERAWKMSDVALYDNLSAIRNGDYVVDILRARTFGSKYPSAYIVRNGKKYYVEVSIREAE